MKRPEQILAALDKLVACGLETSVYFVDDNFIANRRAVLLGVLLGAVLWGLITLVILVALDHRG